MISRTKSKSLTLRVKAKEYEKRNLLFKFQSCDLKTKQLYSIIKNNNDQNSIK